MQTMLQGGTATTGGQYDGVIVDTHIFRVDDLIGLHVLQHTILVNTRGVCEGVTTHDRLIGLHRHVHQARYHTARAVNLCRVDVGDDLTLLMALEDHGDLLQRGVTGTLADTVDGHLHLAGTIQDTLYGVSGSHT